MAKIFDPGFCDVFVRRVRALPILWTVDVINIAALQRLYGNSPILALLSSIFVFDKSINQDLFPPRLV